jgi:hypothetical protein
MESKRKCKSDNEAEICCVVMTLDEEIKIVDTLRGGLITAAFGLTNKNLTFRWYFALTLNFPMETLLYYTVYS